MLNTPMLPLTSEFTLLGLMLTSLWYSLIHVLRQKPGHGWQISALTLMCCLHFYRCFHFITVFHLAFMKLDCIFENFSVICISKISFLTPLVLLSLETSIDSIWFLFWSSHIHSFKILAPNKIMFEFNVSYSVFEVPWYFKISVILKFRLLMFLLTDFPLKDEPHSFCLKSSCIASWTGFR